MSYSFVCKWINVGVLLICPQMDKCQSYQEVVGWCEGVMYLMSPGRPTDIGLQLGKACYPCSR